MVPDNTFSILFVDVSHRIISSPIFNFCFVFFRQYNHIKELVIEDATNDIKDVDVEPFVMTGKCKNHHCLAGFINALGFPTVMMRWIMYDPNKY